MNYAWLEDAKGVEFDSISQAAFLSDIELETADDATIAVLESELKMKRDVCGDKR